MSDKFGKYAKTLESPGDDAFAVTPSDATIFAQPTRFLYVGTAGHVKVMFTNKANSNTVVTFSNVQNGTVLNLRVQQVLATGTTASNIVGIF